MLNELFLGLILDWPWLLGLAVAVVLGVVVERYGGITKRRRFHRSRSKALPVRAARAHHDTQTREPPPFDPAQQLREVECASFTARRLLNRGESRLMATLDRVIGELELDWRVMAQVSMGEILASPSELAYRAINSKRVDLLLVCAQGHPLYAIEYQGSGHHLGPAATRDAIKREALRKAGIGYIEVMPGDTPAELRTKLAKLAQRATAA